MSSKTDHNKNQIQNKLQFIESNALASSASQKYLSSYKANKPYLQNIVTQLGPQMMLALCVSDPRNLPGASKVGFVGDYRYHIYAQLQETLIRHTTLISKRVTWIDKGGLLHRRSCEKVLFWGAEQRLGGAHTVLCPKGAEGLCCHCCQDSCTAWIHTSSLAFRSSAAVSNPSPSYHMELNAL